RPASPAGSLLPVQGRRLTGPLRRWRPASPAGSLLPVQGRRLTGGIRSRAPRSPPAPPQPSWVAVLPCSRSGVPIALAPFAHDSSGVAAEPSSGEKHRQREISRGALRRGPGWPARAQGLRLARLYAGEDPSKKGPVHELHQRGRQEGESEKPCVQHVASD